SRYTNENTWVFASPSQSINITIRDSSSCAKTSGQLCAGYGTPTDFSPLTGVKGFNATISEKNANATFRFNATGLSGQVSGLYLYKLFEANGTNLSFKAYSRVADNRTDGAWWMTDVNGTYLDRAAVLDNGATYYFAFTVKDNGDYDANATLGEIRDPTVPGRLGVTSIGSDDAGCVFHPRAGFSLELILLILAALVLPCARRRG
ncbi:MAG: hypothetical protein SVS15_08995, partial [Thermodesulfobacteriota bacterium]|nr:hypothetical protein [Thermodesulfobacteriota bacterium]